MRDAETERVRRLYDRVAPRYDRLIRLPEQLLFGDGRRWVCSRARGDVLEVAVGTGRNLPFYPASVRLTAIDVSPAMLRRAETRARRLGRAVILRHGDARTLEFPAGSFDTVVFTLALCSIPDDRAAIAEAARVLRPGGAVLLLEHVRSPVRPVRAVQRLLEPLFLRFGGDHLLREPIDRLRGQGFAIRRVERSRLGIVERAAACRPVG